MTRSFAKLVSFIGHPIFIITYLLLVVLVLNPYLFSIQDAQSLQLVVISVVALSVGFPLITITMLRFLGMVSSFELDDRMERIGPLVATGLFYLWLYINIYKNSTIPHAFAIMVLGSTIGLFVAFFINNFSKISLHGVGMGGFVAAIILFRFFYCYDYFILSSFKLNADLLVLFSILFAGMVGTCRLYLNKHNNAQLYAGYFVGVVSQLIAFRILF